MSDTDAFVYFAPQRSSASSAFYFLTQRPRRDAEEKKARTVPYVLPKWLKGLEPTGHQDISTLWVERWRAE